MSSLPKDIKILILSMLPMETKLACLQKGFKWIMAPRIWRTATVKSLDDLKKCVTIGGVKNLIVRFRIRDAELKLVSTLFTVTFSDLSA